MFLNYFLVSNINKDVNQIAGQFFQGIEEEISPNQICQCQCASESSSKNRSSTYTEFASSTACTSTHPSKSTNPSTTTHPSRSTSDSSTHPSRSSDSSTFASSKKKRESDENYTSSKRQNVGSNDEDKLTSFEFGEEIFDEYEMSSEDDDDSEYQQNTVKEKDVMKKLSDKSDKVTYAILSIDKKIDTFVSDGALNLRIIGHGVKRPIRKIFDPIHCIFYGFKDVFNPEFSYNGKMIK